MPTYNRPPNIHTFQSFQDLVEAALPRTRFYYSCPHAILYMHLKHGIQFSNAAGEVLWLDDWSDVGEFFRQWSGERFYIERKSIGLLKKQVTEKPGEAYILPKIEEDNE